MENKDDSNYSETRQPYESFEAFKKRKAYFVGSTNGHNVTNHRMPNELLLLLKKERKQKEKIKNIIGWTGVVLLLLAYFLLTIEFYNQHDLAFNSMNLVGGSCLAWRVFQDKNYSNFILELVFCAIAIAAIVKSLIIL